MDEARKAQIREKAIIVQELTKAFASEPGRVMETLQEFSDLILELTNPEYDSSTDTLNHIRLVQAYMACGINVLLERMREHDLSKLESPEKDFFDKYTPRLATLEFGTKAYSDNIHDMKPALEHHYANNSHHPQYYGEKGISGMNLFDLFEMFFDWKASSERGVGGDIMKSIQINRTRKAFNMSDQVAEILTNTAKFLGYDQVGDKS